MRVTTLLVGSILLFMVGSTAARTTRTQHAPRPLSAADVEHGLKSAVPNARMAALVKKYGVDFELTDTVKKELRSAGASDNLILQIGRSRARVDGQTGGKGRLDIRSLLTRTSRQTRPARMLNRPRKN